MIPDPVPPATPLAWSRLLIEGPDAASYLQGQVTQDVTALGEGAWTFVLAPDGAVVSHGWLAPHGDGYALSVASELAEVTRVRLRRFLLRVNCIVAVEPVEEGPLRTEGERVARAWPGVAELAARLAPQSYGADVVERSVSFTKGCYTGQELVARLHARGANVPWRLVRASGPDVGAIEQLLTSKGPAGPSGVTSAVEDGVGVRALGIAHRTLHGDEADDSVHLDLIA